MRATAVSLYPFTSSLFFFSHVTPTTPIYTLSLHDALPIYPCTMQGNPARLPATPVKLPVKICCCCVCTGNFTGVRSEEHTSELQSRLHLVCRLLLEKKKKQFHTSRS